MVQSTVELRRALASGERIELDLRRTDLQLMRRQGPQFAIPMKTVIRKIGGSFGIIIPTQIARHHGFYEKMAVTVVIQESLDEKDDWTLSVVDRGVVMANDDERKISAAGPARKGRAERRSQARPTKGELRAVERAANGTRPRGAAGAGRAHRVAAGLASRRSGVERGGPHRGDARQRDAERRAPARKNATRGGARHTAPKRRGR